MTDTTRGTTEVGIGDQEMIDTTIEETTPHLHEEVEKTSAGAIATANILPILTAEAEVPDQMAHQEGAHLQAGS